MKLLSIVGARPQFVKAAVITDALAGTGGHEHRLVHTGQHYDARMSDSFFRQLRLPQPDYSLGIGSGPHGAQTGAMLASIEEAMLDWHPDAVIVYGDTNSTLAGALAAVKLHIPVVHLEAGLRSFNRRMPEEINRVVSDHVSALLLCPTGTAVRNARSEGLGEKCTLVGDVMLDALLKYAAIAPEHLLIEAGRLKARGYALVTLHRAENTDDDQKLDAFVDTLERLPLPVVLPMHPRLKAKLGDAKLQRLEAMEHVHLLGPCEYLEMLALERDALVILTDSGGVQKEAYFLAVPCLTLREETEWQETLAGEWNRVLGTDPQRILPVVESLVRGNGATPRALPDLDQFGGGKAGLRCVEAISAMERN